MRLSNEVAIVTGAGRGIGAEVARALAREGAAVAVTARKLADAEKVAAAIEADDGRAKAFRCDVTDAQSVHHAVDAVEHAFGVPTIFINNAGQLGTVAKFADIEPHDFAHVIEVNLVGAAIAARAVLKRMLVGGRGTIVNVSSGAASRAIEAWSAYCASKAGLSMLTRSLALEYGGVGIRVFGFAPGIVDTDMQGEIRASGIGPLASLPREKLADPREPADAIAFLCSSDGASFAGRELDIRDPAFREAAGLKPLPA